MPFVVSMTHTPSEDRTFCGPICSHPSPFLIDHLTTWSPVYPSCNQPCKVWTMTSRTYCTSQLTHSWHQSTAAARRRLLLAGAARKDADVASRSKSAVAFDQGWLLKQSLYMAVASAVLGPLCDGQHSSHNVLHYHHPLLLNFQGYQLETCWWVPCLFAVAGIILGASHPFLDNLGWADRPRGGADPSWSWVLLGIAYFVTQYAASGILEEPLLGEALGPLPVLDVLLLATGVVHWWLFDGTRQGLGMACLTAVAGPLVEIVLINWVHLYHYVHPQVWGVPTFITWVYWCGATAVGNLGRKVSASVLREAGVPDPYL